MIYLYWVHSKLILINLGCLRKEGECGSAWNGRLLSRQMRLISYSGVQKLLQIR
jgi:hypothetical protein